MHLIYGLGNPGPDYSKTRHNFGAWIVDALARDNGGEFGPGKGDYIFALDKGKDIALVKSTGYMNESGWPLYDAMDFVQAGPENILVIYDDIALPLGTIRFRPEGGTGGHKGMESILGVLGTEEFPRLRIGIATDTVMRPSENYVLAPFRENDLMQVDEVMINAVEGIEHYLTEGIESAMNKYNTSSPE